MTFEITLKHIGGDIRTLTVQYVAPSLTYLSLRWGQSGIYDLNLAKNVLTARSQKAQRKGKTHWCALDIGLVRKLAANYIREQNGGKAKEEIDKSIKKHQESMP